MSEADRDVGKLGGRLRESSQSFKPPPPRAPTQLPPMQRKQGIITLPASLRIAWNYVQAKLHHAYPCGRCGYRYHCGDPPGSDCHS